MPAATTEPITGIGFLASGSWSHLFLLPAITQPVA
jgi:hypothetical protein